MKWLILITISFSVCANKLCSEFIGPNKTSCEFAVKTKKLLKNKSQMDQCQLIKNDKEDIFFIFEGGGVYSKELYDLHTLKEDIFEGFSYEDYTLLSPLFKNFEQTIFEKKKSGSYTIRFLAKNNFFNSYKNLIYLPHNKLKTAKRCIQKLNLKNRKLKIISLSWGGDTAQRFIKYLRRNRIEVDSVFFIDPVRKGFLSAGTLRNIFTRSNSPFFYKSSNVKRMYNFYQKTDDGSLGITKIRGNSIPSSDINVNLSTNCLSETAKIPFARVNHKSAIRCPVVLNRFVEFLSI